MALTPTKFIPNEMKTSIVKIYAYDNNNLIGTLYNPYLKVEKKFLSTFNLLNLIEETMAVSYTHLEMRDYETISTAMTAAETGHLVISTLHTVGASNTVDRIIDVFPANQQPQIRVQLAMLLQAIVSQQLVPTEVWGLYFSVFPSRTGYLILL